MTERRTKHSFEEHQALPPRLHATAELLRRDASRMSPPPAAVDRVARASAAWLPGSRNVVGSPRSIARRQAGWTRRLAMAACMAAAFVIGLSVLRPPQAAPSIMWIDAPTPISDNEIAHEVDATDADILIELGSIDYADIEPELDAFERVLLARDR